MSVVKNAAVETLLIKKKERAETRISSKGPDIFSNRLDIFVFSIFAGRILLRSGVMQAILLTIYSLLLAALVFISPSFILSSRIASPEEIKSAVERLPLFPMAISILYPILAILIVCIYYIIINNILKKKEGTASASGKPQGQVVARHLLFLLPLFPAIFLPAFTSDDIYYYLGLGRIQAMHGLNPYLNPIASAAGDPLSAVSPWTKIPTMYAPGIVLFFRGIVHFAGPNLIAELILYRLFVLAAVLGASFFIRQILLEYRPAMADAGMAGFLLNPLILTETIGNGHNDIFCILLLLSSFFALLKNRESFSLILYFCAFLIKFPAIILLPLYLFLLFRRKGISVWKDIWPAIIFIVAASLSVYFLFFRDSRAFKSFEILSFLWSPSTPGILMLILRDYFGLPDRSLFAVLKALRILFVFFAVYRATKVRSLHGFLEEAGIATIVFYSLFSSYIWVWYFTGMLPFLFIRKRGDYLLPMTGLTAGGMLFWWYYFQNTSLDTLRTFAIEYFILLVPFFVLLLLTRFRPDPVS